MTGLRDPETRNGATSRAGRAVPSEDDYFLNASFTSSTVPLALAAV